MADGSAARPERGAPAAPAEAAREGAVGRVHSLTTGSMVDGPGVRSVIWTSGCELRCVYCHNPDTWRLGNGTPREADAVVRDVARHRRFMAAAGGGVTVSGGEPLVQARFVTRVLRGCQALGIHTALDTNGFLGERLADDELPLADLVLLDLKSYDPETHRRVTGRDVGPVLRFARRLSDAGRPAWIRFVLVPGVTDAPANVAGLAAFVATLGNVERVEVLPFHQMGRSKWERLGVSYPLARVNPASAADLARARAAFRAHGLPVIGSR